MRPFSQSSKRQPTDLDEQLTQLTVQIARRVLSVSRKVFAISEWTTESEVFAWPWDQSETALASREGRKHWRLLHRLTPKLTSNGCWCIVDKNTEGKATAALHPMSRNIRSSSQVDSPSTTARLNAIEEDLGSLILRSDEREICRLIAALEGQYDWIGFYIRHTNLLELAPLLRYCEAVLVAVRATKYLDQSHLKVFQAWNDAKIPVQGVFRVMP